MIKFVFFLVLFRSCYMVFPSLQLALALSCVMGLIMFARYCGEDQLGSSSADAVSYLGLICFCRFLDCYELKCVHISWCLVPWKM